jgi:hypothetical protein
MTTTAVTALEVADEDFLVASLIERCPKTMMLRELMMNALEAAQHAPDGRRLVEISAQNIDAADKLTIWNTGPGMDAPELLKVSNIASSLGKAREDIHFGLRDHDRTSCRRDLSGTTVGR